MSNSGNQDYVIRLKELIALTGLSKSTLYAKQDKSSHRYDEKFPKKIKLGQRSVGYFRSDVEAWLNSKIQGGSID